MKKVVNSICKFIEKYLHWFIVGFVALLCVVFLSIGQKSENGYITLDGKDAEISESTEKFIEDSQAALYRIMNEDAPTDEAVEAENAEPEGKGFYTTIDQILGRRLADGNNDGGKGWQCSRYTGWLATGKWSYSTAHPDYGPVNGKDVAAWLVKNYGFKYISTPVAGAIGSGGFNTIYGHTAMYLYSTGSNTAMVNDANYVPLTVGTHNMNISGWVWVVPGNYNPNPTPKPTPAPTPSTPSKPAATTTNSYVVKRGDTLGGIALKLGWYRGGKLFGDDGYAQKLADFNGIKNRGLIYPNQVIKKVGE